MSPALVLLLATLSGSPELRIFAGSGVRLRAAADAGSEVVSRAPFGEVLPCSRRIDGFCETEVDGGVAYFAESLSQPFTEKDAQATFTKLAEKRVGELGSCAKERKEDVWGLQRFLIDRAAAETDAVARGRYRLLELKLLAKQACLYLGGDARVYRDDSQGERLKREAIWKLADEYPDSAFGEEVARFAVAHGRDLECEGDSTCLFSWTRLVECGYLERYPKGPQAKKLLGNIKEAAEDLREAVHSGELPKDGIDDGLRKTASEIAACVAKADKRVAAPATKAIEALADAIAVEGKD